MIRSPLRRAPNSTARVRVPRIEALEVRRLLADCGVVTCEQFDAFARKHAGMVRFLGSEMFPKAALALSMGGDLAKMVGPRVLSDALESTAPRINDWADFALEFAGQYPKTAYAASLVGQAFANNLSLSVPIIPGVLELDLVGFGKDLGGEIAKLRPSPLGSMGAQRVAEALSTTEYAEATTLQYPAARELFKQLGYDSTLSASQIAASDPGSLPAEVVEIINSGGGFSEVDAEQMIQKAVQGFGQQVQATLTSAIQKNNQVLIDGFIEAYKKASEPSQVERDWTERRDTINNLAALGSFASQVLQFVDPEAARKADIATRGGSQIAHSINDLSRVLESGGFSGSFLGGLSALAGIGGGVLTLASMFSSPGPSTDQIILEELSALREMIDQLRTEMHERFDRIDERLNDLTDQIAAGFHKIDLQNEILSEDMQLIQRDMLDVLRSLDALQDRTQEMLQDSDRQNFERKVLDCLNYEERTGQAIPFEAYDDCQVEFQLWGNVQSKKPLWAGSLLADYSLDAIADELSGTAPVSKINYLAEFPSRALGLPALAAGRIANPVEWMEAANAYIQLVQQSPGHARNALVVNSLIATGEALGEAAMRIAALPDENGGLSGNTALFESLFTAYRDALAEFDGAVRAIEDEYIRLEMPIAETSDPSDFLNPWLEASAQGTNTPPKIPHIAGPLAQQLYAPPGLATEVPRFYALAARSPGNSLTATIDNVHWRNERTATCMVGDSYEANRPSECLVPVRSAGADEPSTRSLTFADLAFDVTIRLNGSSILANQVEVGSISRTFGGGVLSAEQVLIQNWRNDHDEGEVDGEVCWYPNGVPAPFNGQFCSPSLNLSESLYRPLHRVEEGPAAAVEGASVPDNLALATRGGIPFASSDLGPDLSLPYHRTNNLNDGFYGNSYSWIGGNHNPFEPKRFAGIDLGATPVTSIQSLAFGRANVVGPFTDRWPGVYTVQYTQAPHPSANLHLTDSPDPKLGWVTLGALDYRLGDGTEFEFPSFRHRYNFSPVDATGIRILVPATGFSGGTAIDEIELYDVPGVGGIPMTTVIPESELATRQSAADRLEPILDQHRREIYQRVADAIDASSPVQRAARKLSGLRDLLHTYVLFGLPDTIASNDFMKALLYGEVRIPGQQELLEEYSTLANAEDPTHERFAPIGFSEQRFEILEALLRDALSGIESGQQSVGLPDVNTTLLELKALRALYLTDRPPSPAQLEPIETQSAFVNTIWSKPTLFFAEGEQWQLTVDYGDGSALEQLPFVTDQSSPLFHDFVLAHTYQNLGNYPVIVTVVDLTGETAAVVEAFVVNVSALAKIDGVTWNDLDADGVRDANEPTRGDVTVFIDRNRNGQQDAEEPVTVSNGLGVYGFSDIIPGPARVIQSLPPDIVQTSPYDLGAEFVVAPSDAPAGTAELNGGHSATNIHGMSVVTWVVAGNVYARIYHADGLPAGPAIVVSESTLANGGPRAVINDEGEFLISWYGKAPDQQDTDIFGRLFAADGGDRGPRLTLNHTSNVDQNSQSVAMWPNGDFIVVYSEQRNDGLGFTIYGEMFDGHANPLQTQIVIENSTDGSRHARPVAAINPVTQEFVVTWSTRSSEGDHFDVHARRFTRTADAIGDRIAVNPVDGRSHLASAIAFDQLGNFDIVWNTSEIGEELYGRRFDTFGIQLGNAYRINAALPGDQHVGPNAVAVDSNGNMIVAWNEQVTQQAFVRRFNRVAGAIHSSEDFLIGAGGGVSVSVDGRGNTFASWLRAGDGVIARRLSPTFNKLYHDLYLEPGVTISGINFGARRAGDTNGDGVVNLVDLNNVRNNFGGEGVGDADGDGDVDLADLNAVRNNFGATLPGDGIVGDTNGDRSVDLVDLNNVRNNFGGQGLGDTDGNGTVDLEDLNAVRNNFGTGDSSPITTLSAADVLFSRLGDGDYKVIAPQFDSVKALFSSRMRSRHLSARLTSSTSWNDR